MAVPCPRCGRQYDVTLFEFGHTIRCTCGSRVGLEVRIRHVGSNDPDREAERRFVADVMLGRLARWLRFLGFDCAYNATLEKSRMVRLALEEGRTILTCDRGLPEDYRIEPIHVVESRAVEQQLRDVVGCFGLAPSLRPLTRCGHCNRVLEPVAKEDVTNRVPPGVLERHATFSCCPECERVFWDGTHARRIRAVADRLASKS